MKRYFLIIFLALFCLSAEAQRVTLNERNERGRREIKTGIRAFYVDGHMHGCELSYSEMGGQEHYIFTLALSDQTLAWKSLKGQDLMMKDSNGQITTIQSSGVSENSLARDTKGSGVSYMCTTSYTLTKEQAEVFRNGLVKLRINITYDRTGYTSLFDVEIPSDLTEYLKKAIKNIDKTIPKPVDVDKSVF
jgi:hypothetical protein